MRELPQSTPPVFCSTDGMRLNDGVFVAQPEGFDVITGDLLPLRVHDAKKCPTHGHDEWRLYDGKWLRVQP